MTETVQLLSGKPAVFLISAVNSKHTNVSHFNKLLNLLDLSNMHESESAQQSYV